MVDVIIEPNITPHKKLSIHPSSFSFLFDIFLLLFNFFPDRPPGSEEELVAEAGDQTKVTVIQPSELETPPGELTEQELVDQASIVVKIQPDEDAP